MDQGFRDNVNRYETALKPYGFEIANGYTTENRVVYSHENGWAVELKDNRVWRLLDPEGKTVRSDCYLNDLHSALDSRIEKGVFKK
jgi:hypothetical protein